MGSGRVDTGVSSWVCDGAERDSFGAAWVRYWAVRLELDLKASNSRVISLVLPCASSG